ncbi:MAG: hypothetical protein AB8G16_17800 [Gammaproteobacteria bacterium]
MMSLGLIYGGYLALSDRAEAPEAQASIAASHAVALPDPESELLPPMIDLDDAVAPIGDLIARNHWNDMDSPGALDQP